ncbi:serpin family protein [Ureibacillus manganicus]|uniref:serpin family protein n=1 Tax=Ureibacillus manganicus TaxID=1266064 RepID=UPI00056BE212|nr:serpin family protein [Ureibacillus manganicus]
MKRVFILLVSLSIVLVGCGSDSSFTTTTTQTLKIADHVEFGEDDYQKIVSSNNELGFDLLVKAPRDDNGNIFISPTSLYMALSMVYNGADGVTKEEMEKVLYANGLDPDELNRANASLMTLFAQSTEQIQLNIANSIWLNDKYSFQEEFATTNKDYFNAEIKTIDVQNPQSPKMINDWVNRKTNGTIDKIVDDTPDPGLVAMLLNAIYFKGNWTYPFKASLTEDKDFTLTNGSTIKIPLMKLKEELLYTKNNVFQAVSLPYGKENMSMKVFLPHENVGLKEFEEMLSTEQWENWIDSFYKLEGTILLPKFSLEYEVGLIETLEALGMPSAFKNANFSKMIEGNSNLVITSVKQKTFIDVNEEGTEAAAVTKVEMGETAIEPIDKPFYMEVNRPFFIAIVDETSGTILFMGSITNPQ